MSKITASSQPQESPLSNDKTELPMALDLSIGDAHTIVIIGKGTSHIVLSPCSVSHEIHGTNNSSNVSALLSKVADTIARYGIFIVDSRVLSLYPAITKTISDRHVYVQGESVINHDGGGVSIATETTPESLKSWSSLESVLTFLGDSCASRRTPIISIGGGALSDLSGLSASIYMRGMPLYIVPTTLISMIDSSIGGKNGINFQGIKNAIGTIYHPTYVIIDIDFLTTLPSIEVTSGIMEAVKLGVILDWDLFSFIQRNISQLIQLDRNSINHLIVRSLEIKAAVVNIDMNDNGERIKLNFGHTIGHAIETDSQFSIPHGVAIAIGMYWEIKLAEYVYQVHPQVCSEKPTRSTNELLDEIQTISSKLQELLVTLAIDPCYIPTNTEMFMSNLLQDKKKNSTGIYLPLIYGKGIAILCVVPNSIIIEFCNRSIFEK